MSPRKSFLHPIQIPVQNPDAWLAPASWLIQTPKIPSGENRATAPSATRLCVSTSPTPASSTSNGIMGKHKVSSGNYSNAKTCRPFTLNNFIFPRDGIAHWLIRVSPAPPGINRKRCLVSLTAFARFRPFGENSLTFRKCSISAASIEAF